MTEFTLTYGAIPQTPKDALGPKRTPRTQPLFIGDVATRTPSGTLALDLYSPKRPADEDI